MKTKISIIFCLLSVICSSCSDWLDVKPNDKMTEEQTFTSMPGFKQALNGVYIELNQNSLYGRQLTCDFIEVIAQRYDVSESQNQAKYDVMQLINTNTTTRSVLSSAWGKAYNLIANVNLIIKNCEQHREILPDDYYHLIKGEAYALRAFLHFDLFRLFGPIYTLNPEAESIPYYTEQTLNVEKSLIGTEFMEKVLDDLKTAEEELKDDPIIKFGVNGDVRDVFLQFRNLRLNFYAVQGLLARAYYYMGDDENAYTYAKKIIDIQESKFPWVRPIALTGAVPDRVFSTEVMFALQNLSRENIYTSLFDGNNLKMNSLLAPREDVLIEVFGGVSDAASDYRVMTCHKNQVEINGTSYRIFNKYQGVDSLRSQMIPLIRVSEAYMIASELAPDNNERVECFNKFINNRGLKSVNNVRDVDYYLPKEWLKEFYGEGQLFYWYKRNHSETMRSAIDPYNSMPFNVPSMQSYVMPLPDEETKYN